MPVTVPIDPYDDPRVTHEFAVLNGRKYHYVHGLPQQNPPRASILLIHGFPDLWYSWRFIIPSLLKLGLRVIAPDMIGYGQTVMPRVPPRTMEAYSWKSSADDMAELMRQLNIPRVILLGHDWGGAIVSRIYLWHPRIVTHIVSVCTPYYRPMRKHVPVEELVRRIPSFTYQIAFEDPQTEKDLDSREAIGRFIRGLHRGLGDTFTGKLQVRKDILKAIGDQPRGKLLSARDLSFYVEEFARNGFHGPCISPVTLHLKALANVGFALVNWYKCRYQNYLDERNLENSNIDVPYLHIAATHDVATPPSLALVTNQAAMIRNLSVREVESSHWVLVECPEQVNGILKEWVEGVCLGSKTKL